MNRIALYQRTSTLDQHPETFTNVWIRRRLRRAQATHYWTVKLTVPTVALTEPEVPETVIV
jgi:hypothetical protein